MLSSGSGQRVMWLCAAMVLALAAAGAWAGMLSAASTDAATGILIDAVLYDGYALNDADEAVRLMNIADHKVDLSGWQLSDGGSGVAAIPDGISLAPGHAVWMTRDATAFRREFGEAPDLQLEGWPGFANEGDEVVLRDKTGALVDVLVYVNGEPVSGAWTGEAVQPYKVASLFAAEGQVLYRQRDPLTGLPVTDTNTALDWAQSRADFVNGRKVRFPGWQSERFFFPATFVTTAPLRVAVAPDNAYAALKAVVDAAEESVYLASLTLEHVGFGNALAAAARRGIDVVVLLEGAPPGGISDQERYICRELEAAGGACWFMISDAATRTHDRYRFMHAKYMVVDGHVAVVGSENFSADSLPDDDKSDGTWGRRGVFLIVESPGIAGHLTAIFNDDLDTAHPDILRWSATHAIYGAPPTGFVPVTVSGGITYTVRFPHVETFEDAAEFVVIQAPENALHPTDGLLGLIGEAGQGDQLLIQQLAERPYWGTTTSNPQADPNPRLEAYIAAARRGAEVRMLLDDYFDVATSPVSNAATCVYVNEVARRESLRLRCTIGNPTGLGLHNKMVLARINGKGYVHVGSINGTELSNKGNREVALQIQSDGAFQMLASLFEGDHPHSAQLPIVFAQFDGAVDHVVISEVVYDTPGPDEAEFVELANPTGVPVELLGYALGDAVYPTDFEDMRLFPPGAAIPAYGVLVVALNGTAFRAEFGVSPDLEIVDSDPLIPDMVDDPDWGDPKALFQLGNAGDEVLLRRWDGLIDVVTYGTGYHSAVVGCPALVAPNRTLERMPYWRDTNNCLNDFRAWPFPSPGRPGK